MRWRYLEVDGHLFRVSGDNPRASAKVWRNGEWAHFPLTSAEFAVMNGIRQLTDEEVKERGLEDV